MLRRHEEAPFMCWAPHIDGSGVGVLSTKVFGHECMLDALAVCVGMCTLQRHDEVPFMLGLPRERE